MTRLFTMLSVVWLAVSVIASIPFWLDSWPPPLSSLEWLCIFIMLPEPVLIALAVIFAFKEQPRGITEEISNPDYDLRKLY